MITQIHLLLLSSLPFSEYSNMYSDLDVILYKKNTINAYDNITINKEHTKIIILIHNYININSYKNNFNQQDCMNKSINIRKT